MHTVGWTGTKWRDGCPGFLATRKWRLTGLADSPCLPALDVPERLVGGGVMVAFLVQPGFFDLCVLHSAILALAVTVLQLGFAPFRFVDGWWWGLGAAYSTVLITVFTNPDFGETMFYVFFFYIVFFELFNRPLICPSTKIKANRTSFSILLHLNFYHFDNL